MSWFFCCGGGGGDPCELTPCDTGTVPTYIDLTIPAFDLTFGELAGITMANLAGTYRLELNGSCQWVWTGVDPCGTGFNLTILWDGVDPYTVNFSLDGTGSIDGSCGSVGGDVDFDSYPINGTTFNPSGTGYCVFTFNPGVCTTSGNCLATWSLGQDDPFSTFCNITWRDGGVAQGNGRWNFPFTFDFAPGN